jgi:queuine tRNA-ribosyltransferase
MFKIIAHSENARCGKLQLKHGSIETPIFMPVGTAGSVKTMTTEDLNNLKVQIILGNTYHLYLRPGMDIIKSFGGIHNFINWNKPILSDSGGFQIFSLGKNCKITEECAIFQSHIDGSKVKLSPEKSVWIQETLGSDIHMVLDECTPHPATPLQAKESLERTARWAIRSRAAKTKTDLMQFGIIQGSIYENLRKQSLELTTAIDFEGYSIGGLSVGEPKDAMREVTEQCCKSLPTTKPRYLMGVGTPLDLIESVALGVDMFDCVMPTRNARNGCLFTSSGKVTIKQKRYTYDKDPLDPKCSCYTCSNFSKAYLRHLFKAKELTALRLFTLHNLSFYIQYMETIRKSIRENTFSKLLREQQNIWSK